MIFRVGTRVWVLKMYLPEISLQIYLYTDANLYIYTLCIVKKLHNPGRGKSIPYIKIGRHFTEESIDLHKKLQGQLILCSFVPIDTFQAFCMSVIPHLPCVI